MLAHPAPVGLLYPRAPPRHRRPRAGLAQAVRQPGPPGARGQPAALPGPVRRRLRLGVQKAVAGDCSSPGSGRSQFPPSSPEPQARYETLPIAFSVHPCF